MRSSNSAGDSRGSRMRMGSPQRGQTVERVVWNTHPQKQATVMTPGRIGHRTAHPPVQFLLRLCSNATTRSNSK